MSQDNQNQPSASYIMGSLSSVSIEHMDLSRRTKNALFRAGLKTALDIQKVINSVKLLESGLSLSYAEAKAKFKSSLM
jgi:hypothetical protein